MDGTAGGVGRGDDTGDGEAGAETDGKLAGGGSGGAPAPPESSTLFAPAKSKMPMRLLEEHLHQPRQRTHVRVLTGLLQTLL